ncbi:MAG: uracil-DNA glycosylase [Flavobacteriales bacterium]|jgi:uracil-DNA glycosylase|nr:uracil-DNA glycosylase [Flavobacteriales bacterium]
MSLQIEASWKNILNNELEQKYFLELSKKVDQFYREDKVQIFPKKKEVFRAFDVCPFEKVKVVILGQDPYPTKGYANGLSFSVNDDIYPFPKSLNNIFKEIHNDIGISFPENGDLTRWAEQGVLLLNTVLTVEEGSPDSHKGIGWEKFTNGVIELLSDQKQELVFMLWGAKATAKTSLINEDKHMVLSSVHPSPLSAYRGFFGCKHFSKANDYLNENNLSVINW